LPVIISLLLVFLLLSTLGNLLDYISSPFLSLSFFHSFSHFSHLPTLVHSRSPFSRSLFTLPSPTLTPLPLTFSHNYCYIHTSIPPSPSPLIPTSSHSFLIHSKDTFTLPSILLHIR
ncbi:hypothetical protein F5H01DRAFT_305083, partial [Linnemannia elongata]